MKVFVADSVDKGKITSTDYHWCDNGDLLMFVEFGDQNVSMCGIQSRKGTTHILVKDIDISKEFFTELITESMEKAMRCEVSGNGDFEINFANSISFKKNINVIVDDLLNKASKFNDGQKVRCFNKTVYAI